MTQGRCQEHLKDFMELLRANTKKCHTSKPIPEFEQEEYNLKNFKKAASLLVGISLTATSAMAASLNVNYGSDDRLSITGTDFTNGAVSITVAHSSEGDTYSASTKFAAIKELVPDYEGNISFSTPLPADAVSGNYVVTAYDKSGELKQTFFYVNKVAAQAAFDTLDGNLTDTEFAAALEQYKVELGIGDDLGGSGSRDHDPFPP